MFFRVVYKSGQIFLPFCHNARVWQTDRILIARPRLHCMQRGKSVLITNRKFTTRFLMSLRWTAYVFPKPPQSGLKNAKWPLNHAKVHIFRRKSATEFLCENFQQQSCKAFTGLTMHKWSVGDVPFYLKFWTKFTHSWKNANLESIFAQL